MRIAWMMLLSAACTGDSPLGDDGPAMRIGTGDAAFIPLSNGDDIQVIQGPQGGFHILGALQATGIEPGDTDNLFDSSNPEIHFKVYDGDERVDASNAFIQGLDNTRWRDTYEVVGRFVFLDIESDDELVGRTLRFTAELTDVDGVVLTDERTLGAVASPFNE